MTAIPMGWYKDDDDSDYNDINNGVLTIFAVI